MWKYLLIWTLLHVLRVGVYTMQEKQKSKLESFRGYGTGKDEAAKTVNNKELVDWLTKSNAVTRIYRPLQQSGHLTAHKRPKRFIFASVIRGLVTLGGSTSRASFPTARASSLIAVHKENARQAAVNYDREMRFRLQDLCTWICDDPEWTSWSTCSKPCGGGERHRTKESFLPKECTNLANFNCTLFSKERESCNQGCPNGGSPSDSGCSCRSGWNGRCCATEVRCAKPARLANGHVFGTWPARYGSRATFTCRDGHQLDGPAVITCLHTGHWSNPPPICQRISCTTPPQGRHMHIPSRRRYAYGEQVAYRCDEGYVLEGHQVRTCIRDTGARGRWTGLQPRCKAVNCGVPRHLEHGHHNGTSYSYRAEVTYACKHGYKLMGPSKLWCMTNGQWQGSGRWRYKVPKCVLDRCDPPFIPKFGTVTVNRSSLLGWQVTFACEPGYLLAGEATLGCLPDGRLNATIPSCKAAFCGEAGVPDHGSKMGHQYHYPHSVSYSCQNGYVLQGASRISCQTDGNWGAATPVCNPCCQGTYMDELDKPGYCQPCPEHTYTPAAGATSRRLCTCVKGYNGPPGGPCSEVTCPALYAPTNGTISSCNTTMNSVCEFGCQDGFFITLGGFMVTCLENGEWDGPTPTCSACPINTYKSNDRGCLPCPKHSHTTGEGHTLQGCVCDLGYQGPAGGPCQDLNECDTVEKRGPCGDLCINVVGSYTCGCSIPGHKLDDDQHTCIVGTQCKNLTKEDAPENGGLVCHHYHQQASIRCGVRCNPHFEFPTRVNNYETCGPASDFVWSFRVEDKTAVIPSCIPEYFPGMRAEADVFYFTSACDELTDEEKQEVYSSLKRTLDARGVCKKQNNKVCNIQDVDITCGRNVTRSKRGIMEQVSIVSLTFNLHSLKIGEDPEKDCPRICAFLRIRRAHCVTNICISAYKRFLKIAVMYARQQLQRIYKNQVLRQRLRFEAANRTFEATDRVRSKQVEIQCDPGMKGNVKEGWCVPCEAGTRWDPTTKDCILCPRGSYQLFKNQTACVPCPTGSTSKMAGSLFCRVCEAGRYGDQCGRRCACQHGDCHPVDGSCTCHTGWQGALCDEDIPGCRDVSCYPGVTCTDIPAPGTGFTCGPCPPGYHGDGAKCQQGGRANETESFINLT